MKIKFTELKDQMSEMTGLLFTHPDVPKRVAKEIWIKFRNHGYYVYINFELPFPETIKTEKLVGAGNALNCSEYKRDYELLEHAETVQVEKILDISLNYRGNIEATVLKVRELFEDITKQYLY